MLQTNDHVKNELYLVTSILHLNFLNTTMLLQLNFIFKLNLNGWVCDVS